MRKKLILISGSPCVGKTAVGECLFESYDNSAYLDGDCCIHADLLGKNPAKAP